MDRLPGVGSPTPSVLRIDHDVYGLMAVMVYLEFPFPAEVSDQW